MSLAEAKSLWALVQHREFFMAFALRHTVPSLPIRGFCGDMFAVDPLPISPLYHLPAPLSWSFLIAAPFTRFLWPSWLLRAKHATALLEFASQISASDQGSFFVCDASTEMFGIDSHGDVKMTSWNHIYSYYELQSLAVRRSCDTDADCVLVPPHCQSSCDIRKQKCTLPLPAVVGICRLLEPYLLPNAPDSIAVDAARLVNQCTDMNASAAELPLQTTIITSALKSLLWRYISTHIS